jgi:hypothetical protein
MNHGRIRQGLLGLAPLFACACHSSANEDSNSFLDKRNGANGVSESMAQSRELGLLLRPLQCTPTRVVLGDSVAWDIREAYLEKGWQCGPKCASVKALNESERSAQIVLKCTRRSQIGSLNIYWFVNPGERENGFYETGGGGLVSQRLSPRVAFPLTYRLYTLDPDGKTHNIGALVLR